MSFSYGAISLTFEVRTDAIKRVSGKASQLIIYSFDALYEPCVPLLALWWCVCLSAVCLLCCVHMQRGGRAAAGVLHPPLLLCHCSDLHQTARARPCQCAHSQQPKCLNLLEPHDRCVETTVHLSAKNPRKAFNELKATARLWLASSCFLKR